MSPASGSGGSDCGMSVGLRDCGSGEPQGSPGIRIRVSGGGERGMIEWLGRPGVRMTRALGCLAGPVGRAGTAS